MLFSYQKYIQLGINIFEYANLFDFLITPFADLKVLFFSILAILLGFLFIELDERLIKKYPKMYEKFNFGMNKKKGFNLFRFGFYGLSLLVLIFAASFFYAKHSYNSLMAQAPIEVELMDGTSEEGIMLGKTNESLFLKTEAEVVIIPVNTALKAIKLNSNKKIK